MSDAPDATPPVPPARPRKQNHAWIGFFVFLVVASVAVAWLMIWYNRGLQLTEEKFKEATALWQEKGPRDYKMTYAKIVKDMQPETYIVTVRNGVVKEVLRNGKPLEVVEGRDLRPYHSMDRLFNDVERFMTLDKQPDSPRAFVTAVFDDQNGALRRYIRSVRATGERVDLSIKIESLKD